VQVATAQYYLPQRYLLRTWDTGTGRPLTFPLPVEDGGDVGFSPDGDRFAASEPRGQGETVLRVRSAANGAPLTACPLPRSQYVHRVGFTPDGTGVLAEAYRDSVNVWDPAGKKGPRWAEPAAQDGPAWEGAVFSPDGRWLLVARADQTARLLDARTGKPVLPPLGHTSTLRLAAFTPEGSRVLTACADGTLRLWDLTGPPPLPSLVVRPEGGESRLVWDPVGPPPGESQRGVWLSPDGRRVLTWGEDGAALVSDAVTGRPVGPGWDFRAGQRRQAAGQAVSYLAAAGDSPWAALAAAALPAGESSGSVPELVHFSPDGGRVLLGDGRWAQVWEVTTGRPTGPAFFQDHVPEHVEFSADGRRLLLISSSAAWVRDVASGSPLAGLDPPVPGSLPRQDQDWGYERPMLQGLLDGEPERKEAVRWGFPLQLALYGVPAGSELARVSPGTLLDCRTDPATGRLLTLTHSKKALEARLWDAANGEPVGPALRLTGPGRLQEPPYDPDEDLAELLNPPLRCFALSPDGRRLAVGDRTGLLVLDVATGEPCFPALVSGWEVTLIRFSPDGRKVLAVSSPEGRDKVRCEVALWNAETGRALTPPLKHPAGVRLASFSPDGRCLVTVRADGVARLWEADRGRPLTPWQEGLDSVDVRFLPGGRRLAFVQGKGARLWDLTAAGTAPEAALALAEVHSGQTLAEDGGVVRLDGDEFLRRWDALRASGGVRPPAPPDLTVWHRAQAARSSQAKDALAAVWHAERLPPGDPGRADLEKRRAAALAGAGRWREAAAAWTRAFEAGDPGSDGLRQRADAYLHLGERERALADGDALVARLPKDPASWDDRAEILARLGQHDRAAADFASSLALREDGWIPPKTSYRLALVRLLAGKAAAYRDLCAAVQPLAARNDALDADSARVFLLGPDVPGVSEVLAGAERARAQAILETAQPLLPERLDWLLDWAAEDGTFLVGALAYRAGPEHDHDALRLLTDAVDLAGDKGHPSAALFLALAHHRLGDDREARRWLYRAEEWMAADAAPWDRELEQRLLYREAEAALREKRP
jgi:WD40 repeat protein/tetratricopeptide (TPR) repeat protein